MSVGDAILAALSNNETFRVERFGPSIASTFVDELRGAFDPVFNANISASDTTTKITDRIPLEDRQLDGKGNCRPAWA